MTTEAVEIPDQPMLPGMAEQNGAKDTGENTACDGFNYRQILDANLGMTYRQLDYLNRRKLIKVCAHSGRGSGNPRHWPLSEVATIRRMWQIVGLGVGDLTKAHALATDREQLRQAIVTLQIVELELGQ